MKKLFLSISCFLLLNLAYAQKDSLQFDEANKYVYYHVVEKPGMNADTLDNRGLLFVEKNDLKSVSKKRVPYAIAVKDKFVIYNNSLASKKQAGEVKYTLNIDSKDQKYRYKFGEFTFTPYKIDRYGNMVAVPGIEIPLEKLSARYSKKDANTYLDQVGMFCKSTAAGLQKYMDRVQGLKKEEPIKKVSTDKW